MWVLVCSYSATPTGQTQWNEFIRLSGLGLLFSVIEKEVNHLSSVDKATEEDVYSCFVFIWFLGFLFFFLV